MNTDELCEAILMLPDDAILIPVKEFQGMLGQTLDLEGIAPIPVADLKALVNELRATKAAFEVSRRQYVAGCEREKVLKAALDEAVKGLEHYADKSNWSNTENGLDGYPIRSTEYFQDYRPLDVNGYDIATKTLATVRGIGGEKAA